MFGRFNQERDRNVSFLQRGSFHRRRLVVFCFLLTALTAVSLATWPAKPSLSPLPAVNAMQQASDQIIPDRYIVTFKQEAFANGVTASGMTSVQLAEQMVSAVDGELHFSYEHSLEGFAATLSPEAKAKLAANPEIAFIEPDQVVELHDVQSPVKSWGQDRIDQRQGPLNGRYRYDLQGADTHIYIIDSGIWKWHTDFGGRVHERSYSAIPGLDPYSDCTEHGHGTHVAGTAGGATFGVAKKAILHSVRVFGCDKTTPLSTILKGVDWVKANHQKPAVANLSLGMFVSETNDEVRGFEMAINNLISSGVIVVVSAGNSNDDAGKYTPARVPAAITVGATGFWYVDVRSTFQNGLRSNYGPSVDIFAPGSNITSALSKSDSGKAVKSGTSMAAPHVTGWVAMYLSAFKQAKPAEVSSVLIGHSTKNVIWEIGSESTPNRLLYVTNIDDADCLTATSVANDAEAAGIGAETASAFELLYRLRNEVFPDSEVGRELIRIHRTHSFEAAKLLLTDQQLRTQLLEMLKSSRPAVGSLLNGDGQRPLDRELIQKIEAYIYGIAQRAGSEMRADLLRALQNAHLWNYEGRPVAEAWKEIGRPQPQRRSRNEVRQQ